MTSFFTQRRLLLKAMLAGGLVPIVGGSVTSCSAKEPLLRVATNVFPSYELMHLASEMGYINEQEVRMVRMPSATACLRALASGSVEGAALTLDEVVAAKADNMPLTIVAVLDVSLGADVVIAKPEISSAAQLRGKRIAVEQSAVGAIMLAATMAFAELSVNDVEIVYATVDQHYDLFVNGEVDALVTFDPVPQKLVNEKVSYIFDSSLAPNLIVDVLVMRAEAIKASPRAVQSLVNAHFHALGEMHAGSSDVHARLAKRLGLKANQVKQAYEGVYLPSKQENMKWLSGVQPQIILAQDKLQEFMISSKLLRSKVDMTTAIDAQFVMDEGV